MLTWAEKPLTHLFCQLSQKPRRQRRCQTLCVILALLSIFCSAPASLHSLYDVDKGLKSWPTLLAPQSLSLYCINENFFDSPDEFFFAHVTTRKEHLGRRRYMKETLEEGMSWRLSMISGNWSEQHSSRNNTPVVAYKTSLKWISYQTSMSTNYVY